MKITSKDISGVRVTTVLGRISGGELPVFNTEVKAVTALTPPVRAVLDFTALDNLPSGALAVLLEAIRAIESSGGRLVLAGENKQVSMVLERMGISQLVTSYPSVDAALKALCSAESNPAQ